MRKGLLHVCFVDFVSVSLELLQCNLKLNNMHSLSCVKVEIKMITNNVKNSLTTLSYHFDFYVGEKYMECLLVGFSDIIGDRSVGAIQLFPMIHCEISTDSDQ